MRRSAVVVLTLGLGLVRFRKCMGRHRLQQSRERRQRVQLLCVLVRIHRGEHHRDPLAARLFLHAWEHVLLH